MKRLKKLGQGMTEYIIIVVLIAIFLIAAVKMYGGELDTIIRGSSKKTDDVGTDAGINPGGPSAGGNNGSANNGGGANNGNNGN